MKRSFFIISLALSWLFSQSQTEVIKEDSWKIKWNKKVLLEAHQSNEKTNTKKIKKTELSKKYSLEVAYKESDPAKEKEWNRSFMFVGDNDNELLRKDSTRKVSITAAELKKLFANQKKIRIYTIAIPTDPDLAARVRVRRVLLCTLELQ
jgi:DNA segregation ATPase FtsK/SpoIIIE-like protein